MFPSPAWDPSAPGPGREATLDGTVVRAREQIAAKGYATALAGRGIAAGRIRSFGIAFRGKEALVG